MDVRQKLVIGILLQAALDMHSKKTRESAEQFFYGSQDGSVTTEDSPVTARECFNFLEIDPEYGITKILSLSRQELNSGKLLLAREEIDDGG